MGDIKKGKVIFIKLSMSNDVKPRGGEVKTTKAFIGGAVTKKNAGKIMGRKLVRHIITQINVNTTTR